MTTPTPTTEAPTPTLDLDAIEQRAIIIAMSPNATLIMVDKARRAETTEAAPGLGDDDEDDQ